MRDEKRAKKELGNRKWECVKMDFAGNNETH